MSWQHDLRLEGFNQIQCCFDLGECRNPFDFRENDAKTVFPERIARNQHACRRRMQNDRIGVVSWCGVRMPFEAAHRERRSWRNDTVRPKWWAMLSCRCVGQHGRIPVEHVRGMAWRYLRLNTGVLILECGIATTVIAVQMGVENVRQRPRPQHGGDQLAGLCCMCPVAGVDQDGLRGVDQQNVVRRQPATLEKMEPLRQGGS